MNHLASEREALFTFLRHEGVPATNHPAEQAVRPLVVSTGTAGHALERPDAVLAHASDRSDRRFDLFQPTVLEQEVQNVTARRILAEVAAMLDRSGYDSVQLVEVARRARVSLRTIYQIFGSREELIIATIDEWMESHLYQKLQPPTVDLSMPEALVHRFRRVFRPWERHPQIAEVFMRAQLLPGGEQLVKRGFVAAEPVAEEIFKDIDFGVSGRSGSDPVEPGLRARLSVRVRRYPSTR